MKRGFSIQPFTGMPDGLLEVRMQKTSLNSTYTPKGYVLHSVERTQHRILEAARRGIYSDRRRLHRATEDFKGANLEKARL
ncbi:hypothetical protein ANCDUO_09909 [Ancylostoma duodenale]|uniref:Uncharacterized protein n=1 Tax=Ancylostoma duodenale TaxID=51022 RepID=A0A0C2CSQ2_9BILA|nr:hypothetical protein ANCDUO_09909 [Ancylostoma duodenale]